MTMPISDSSKFELRKRNGESRVLLFNTVIRSADTQTRNLQVTESQNCRNLLLARAHRSMAKRWTGARRLSERCEFGGCVFDVHGWSQRKLHASAMAGMRLGQILTRHLRLPKSGQVLRAAALLKELGHAGEFVVIGGLGAAARRCMCTTG